MKWLRVSFFLGLLTVPAVAQREVRYYVRDEVKEADIEYTIDRDVVVISPIEAAEQPSLQINYSTHVLGSTLRVFRYVDETYNEKITREQADQLTAVLRQADFSAWRKSGATTCESGILSLEGEDHEFNNPVGDPARDSLQGTVMEAVDKIVPRRKRDLTVHTVEGDLLKTRNASVEKLLAHPAKYDGKRVTITGYFTDEFDTSNLSDEKAAATKKSIWLGSPSTFANNGEIQWTDEGRVTVDGIFMRGSGGHGGAWDGELQRVTRMICLDPKLAPMPRNYESSKRR